MRDLFTQALKHTGEVEDGEYDWMKLNNGRGWEAMSKHPSSHGYNHGQHATTAGELRHQSIGQSRGQQQQLTAGRLNAPQPLPPSPAMQMGKKRERQNAPGVQPLKRPSGPAGAPQVGTPTTSTQAQFQAPQTGAQGRQSQGGAAQNLQQGQQRGQEPKKSAWQKITAALCCG